jgi:hypothetical protein
LAIWSRSARFLASGPLATRRVSSADVRLWVTHQARNLLLNLEDRADGFKFLIRTGTPTFTAAFITDDSRRLGQ